MGHLGTAKEAGILEMGQGGSAHSDLSLEARVAKDMLTVLNPAI